MQLPQEGAVRLKGATGQGATVLDHHARARASGQRTRWRAAVTHRGHAADGLIKREEKVSQR